MTASTERGQRRTESLTSERIIAAAIQILDDGGEGALTFRALAAALATGAGAIYWHVANKNELLAAASDAVVAAVTDAAPEQAAPRAQIRSIALGLFDAFDDHPWVGPQLARENWRLASTRILEAVGSRLTGLGVPANAQFDAASALAGYICGAATQNASNARSAPGGTDRETFLTQLAGRWTELDETRFPFVHQIAAQLPKHDDREQFLAGVDLFLAGIGGR